MFTVILFIVVLSILIFVHELGHFLAAKWSGMRVDEFAIGFPPRIYAWKRGETEYAINALPIGGYVRIHGENPNQESLEGTDASRSFTAKPRWKQAIVLLAGVTFNMLFAWIAIILGFMVGFPVSTDYLPGKEYSDVKVVITDVDTQSPAYRAGIQAGDEIVSLSKGEAQNAETIWSTDIPRIQAFIQSATNTPILLGLFRNSVSTTTEVTPTLSSETGVPALGVGLGTIGTLQLPIHEAMYHGTIVTYRMTIGIAQGLYTFFTGAFSGGEVLSQVAGPVGIAKLVNAANEMGFVYLVSFVALISINLAIINILPFPALDGGRLVFVAIESIIKRPIPYAFANAVNLIGFVLLLGLMLVITVSDVLKLI